MTQIPKASTERPASLEGFLYGKEATNTPGLAVSASVRTRSYKVDFKQEGTWQSFKPSGAWLNSMNIQGSEWSSAPYSGWGNFNEDHLALESTFGVPTKTTVGTTGVLRTWNVDPYALIDPVTYTMAAGQAVRGELYPCGIFNGIKYQINRDGITKSGSIMAQAIQDAVALVGSPTFLAMEPMLPKNTYVKFATTYAGLSGATKFRRAFDIGFEVSGMFGGLQPIVDDNISYDGLSVKDPTAMFSVLTNRTAAAMAFLPYLRASTVLYWEVGNIGRAYESGHNFALKIQAACQINSNFEPSTVQEVAGVTWKWGFVPTDDMVYPIIATLENVIP